MFLRFILSLINITSISTAITPHHDCHSETRSVKSSFPACPHPAWQPQPSTGCIPQCIVILGYPAEHRALLCSVLHNWNSASIFIKSYSQCTQLALQRTCAVCTKSSFQDRTASHRTALCIAQICILREGMLQCSSASHYNTPYIASHFTSVHCIPAQRRRLRRPRIFWNIFHTCFPTPMFQCPSRFYTLEYTSDTVCQRIIFPACFSKILPFSTLQNLLV